MVSDELNTVTEIVSKLLWAISETPWSKFEQRARLTDEEFFCTNSYVQAFYNQNLPIKCF